MITNERDYFGRSQEEYMNDAVLEARRDAVALAEIIHQGKSGFHLTGDLLTLFVRRAIEHLLLKGAKVVIGATKEDEYWQKSEFEGSFKEIEDQIINRWKSEGSDQAYFAWFRLR